MKLFAFALCLSAVGCGGGGLPSGKSGAETDDGLQRFLDDNFEKMEKTVGELEANRQFHAADKKPDEPQAGTEGGEAAPADGAEEAPASPEAPAAEAMTTPDSDEKEEPSKRDRCATACRSLASMKRAEARICDLAGETSDKCSWAHERVKDAVDRIQRAGCECS